MKINLIYGDNSVVLKKHTTELIKNLRENNDDRSVIIIVPDQFSYTYEKLMTKNFGGTGLNGIEVMTFSKLCTNFLKKQTNRLSPVGKTIIIQSILNSFTKNETNVYRGCCEYQGFALKLQSSIEEMKRYILSPENLTEVSSKLEEGILSKKLSSLAEIYSEYNKRVGEKFYDTDNDLINLSEQIVSENLFKDHIFIFNEFSDFLPQHYKIIEALAKVSPKLYFLLEYCKKNTEFLKIPEETSQKIISIAQNINVPITTSELKSDDKLFNSQEIEFYYNNYSSSYSVNFAPYTEKTNDISLFMAKNPYSEIDRVARVINTLVHKEDYKYSDIGIVLGNNEDYNHIIEAVFSDYEIPYFADSQLVITDHPLILSIMGIFDIIDNNWSYDSVFKYLKSGFIYHKNNENVTPYSSDDIDFLENYVLKRGIRGKNKWLSEEDWIYNIGSISDFDDDYDSSDELSIKLNRTRKDVTKHIKAFQEKISGRKSVYELSSAFFEYLCEAYVMEGISYEIEKLNNTQKRNEAEHLMFVWNMLIDVINQLTSTLGNEKCSKKEFRSYIYAGLSALSISIIPSSVDSVTVGSADLTRQKNLKALFVVGSVKGSIPELANNDGIISNSERELLNETFKDKGYKFGQDLKNLQVASDYRFYKVLFTATDKIFISYPSQNFESDSQTPAQFVLNLKKIFTNLSYDNDIYNKKCNENLIYHTKSAFDYYVENRKNIYNPNIKPLYEWFLKKPELKDKLSALKTSDSYKTTQLSISPEHAKALYERHSAYSVSRLNEFSACPFKYFMKYGLRAKEEDVWKIQKFDLGSIMHLAICRYCEIIENNAKTFEELKNNWDNLTKEKSEQIVDEIMSEILQKIINNLDRDESKVKYLINRMSKTIKRSVETVRLSLKNGAYVAAEHEKSFIVDLSDNNDSVKITGTIDRIDVTKIDNAAKIRIVDYKSGKKDFSVVSICNMIDIQLIVYAQCALELYKNKTIRYIDNTEAAQICGIMYNKIRDDFLAVDSESIKNIDEILKKSMKMNGIVILDKEENSDDSLSIENALLMDSSLMENKESSFLNLKLKANDEISKTSDISSRDDFEKLIEYVKKNIILIDKKIKQGDISINPYFSSTSSACDYCKMSEACMFDENFDTVRNLCTTKEEAWNIINKETEKNPE